jgi:radical SAM protein with 4Fe4S-binding SPASM domain
MAEQLQSGPRTAEEVIESVADEYGVPSQAVEPSVHRFLDGLLKRNYLYRVSMRTAHHVEADDLRPKLDQLTLLITTRCSSQCEHCYIDVNADSDESQSDMSVALASDLLQQAGKAEIRKIVISGGEPLLHPQLREILQVCRKQLPKGYLKLQTSGATASDEVIDLLASLVNDVQLGLDGIDAETHDAVRGAGSFDQVVSVLGRLQLSKRKVARGLSFSPMKSNLEQMGELSKLCSQLAVDYLQINHPRQPAHRNGGTATCEHECGYLSQDDLRRSLDMFQDLNKRHAFETIEAVQYGGKLLLVDPSFNPAWHGLLTPDRRKSCQAGSELLCIDPSGIAYPCSALHRRPGCNIGSFPGSPLEKLAQAGLDWNEATFSVDLDPHCGGCVFRYFCGGGCRAAGPEIDEHDPGCRLIQDSFDTFFQSVSSQEGERQAMSPLRSEKDMRHVEIIRCA